MKTLQRIAKVNRKVIPNHVKLAPSPDRVEGQTKSSPIDLFRTSSMALKSIIQSFA